MWALYRWPKCLVPDTISPATLWLKRGHPEYLAADFRHAWQQQKWAESMASLEFDKTSRRYRIRFRFRGRSYQRTTKTGDAEEAAGVVSRVAETIRLLERGRLEMPADADPGIFIISDGKQVKKTVTERANTLEAVLATYQKSIPPGAKAETTIETEGLHIAHLLQHLKKAKPMQSVTTSEMQAYIDKRLRDCYRKKTDPPGNSQEGSRHIPADLELGGHARPCRWAGSNQGPKVSQDRTEAAVHDP